MDDLVPVDLPPPDAAAREAVAARAARALRPAGAFGRLDELAAWLAGWQRAQRPAVERPVAVVFVADHGVALEGVSAYPWSITVEVLAALRAGVATASVLARSVGAELKVVDVGTGRPTGNLAVEPALTPERFAACWQAGRNAVAGADADLLVLGEMGIGNTTAAAAVSAVLHGGPSGAWTGRGTGVDDAGLAAKVAAVDRARRRLADGAGAPRHPLEVLRQVGGSELVAIAGAIVEARLRSLPVVLDGYVVTAAAAALASGRPGALGHCVAGHLSPEPGHRRLLDHLGLAPLLDLGLRLGEASGALAAVPLVRLAVAAVVDVATFDEWAAQPASRS